MRPRSVVSRGAGRGREVVNARAVSRWVQEGSGGLWD